MPALSAAHVARALRPRAILLRLFEVIEATNETHPASAATLVATSTVGSVALTSVGDSVIASTAVPSVTTASAVALIWFGS